jgi:hypothetical protein
MAMLLQRRPEKILMNNFDEVFNVQQSNVAVLDRWNRLLGHRV